eukprot:GFKZ01004017.1.p2 GENE.GFKZ01004017.1~~GFKZ01004017.1.p2  ORF type:complete len:506 (+),score=92.85 GFKZ01004017.1:54-1571(+)
MRAVIVGGGVAGTTCAVTLRGMECASGMEIVLISPEGALRTASLISKVTRSAFDMCVSEESAVGWCEKRGIVFREGFGVRLTKSEVHLSDGGVVGYDAVCIATGARPFLPVGLRGHGGRVLTIRDGESVERVRERVGKARRVMVVGGGGIGMEVVDGLVGCEVVWVVKGGYVGGAFFDERGASVAGRVFGLGKMSAGTGKWTEGKNLAGEEKAAVGCAKDAAEESVKGCGVGPEWLGKRVEAVLLDAEGKVEGGGGRREAALVGTYGWSKGHVKVVCNCEVVALEEDDKGERGLIVTLSDGNKVCCDVVVVGAGVVANVEWLEGSGVQVDHGGEGGLCSGGLVVSAETMMSNVQGVFGAGDCVTMEKGTYGENWFQMRLWTQGMTSGRACGESMGRWMMGEGAEVVGLEFEVFAHVTRFFGKRVVLLGDYNADGAGGEGFEMIEGERDDEFVRVVLRSGRVVGAMLVGEAKGAEVFENLILDGLDVRNVKEKLVDPDFDLEDYFD